MADSYPPRLHMAFGTQILNLHTRTGRPLQATCHPASCCWCVYSNLMPASLCLHHATHVNLSIYIYVYVCMFCLYIHIYIYIHVYVYIVIIIYSQACACLNYVHTQYIYIYIIIIYTYLKPCWMILLNRAETIWHVCQAALIRYTAPYFGSVAWSRICKWLQVLNSNTALRLCT